MENLDILNMTDDEFSKLSPDSVLTEDTEPVDQQANGDPALEAGNQERSEEKTAETELAQENTQEETEAPSGEQPGFVERPDQQNTEPPAPAELASAENPVQTQAQNDGKLESRSEPEGKPTTSEGPDYEAFYKQVMAPFKANGKLIQLQSPDEVIALMQMGANYTKKMQAIQQHKKYLMMLENNGLLDEQKLSFLIDLDKKNPEAIKKLLKDANVDPLEVDTSEEVNYQGGAHTVTDQEAALATAIEEISSMPNGRDTLQSIQAWDAESKKFLWEHPEIMSLIHDQRQNGMYDRINAEIERQRLLGQVPLGVPFLQAYKAVGDAMMARGAFDDIIKKPAQQAPVAVRPARTLTKPADNNKVRAAAPPRSAPRPAKEAINILAMSDEEFAKLEFKI